MSVTTPAVRVSLSPQEEVVLSALQATGQSAGNLRDVPALARQANLGLSVVAAHLVRLHEKGYIHAAGISEVQAEEARRLVNELVGRLEKTQTQEQFAWGDLFRKITYRLRRGQAPSPATVERIGERLGLSKKELGRYAGAAVLLHRYVHSRGRRSRGSSSPEDVSVICTLCGRRMPTGAGGSHSKHPVCRDCAPRWSSAVRRRGLPRHPGGGWLYALVCELYAGMGKGRGVLAAAARDLGVSEDRTLAQWTWNPPAFPHDATVRRLVEGLTRRQQTLGHPDPPVTRDEIMRRFRWTRTWEEEKKRRFAERRRTGCPICGRPIKSYVKTCSFPCRALRQIHSLGLRTDGGQYLFTIMALASDVPIDRIASLVGRPFEMVSEWSRRPRGKELVGEIRQDRTHRWVALIQATARVLDVSVPTLLRYLYHRYRRSDKKKRVAPRFPKRLDLGEKIGMTDVEFMAMFHLKQSFRTYAAEHGRMAVPSRQYKRRGHPNTTCRLVRNVLQLRSRKRLTWPAIADLREDLLMEPKELRYRMIQHGQRCPRCRALVTMDLARAEKRMPSKVANLLRCSPRTVHLDLARMEQEQPFAYRLRTGEVATLRNVSRSTIVRLETKGRLKSLRRSSSGRRIFDQKGIADQPS